MLAGSVLSIRTLDRARVGGQLALGTKHCYTRSSGVLPDCCQRRMVKSEHNRKRSI
jgi:hypothetical protein